MESRHGRHSRFLARCPLARAAARRAFPQVPANAPAKLVLGLALAQFGAYLAVLTPVMVTLALRVSQIVPEGDRGAALGQVLSVGALLAMLGNPVFGALSDRTTSRFGRRRPGWSAA